jgi:hypothetical protein
MTDLKRAMKVAFHLRPPDPRLEMQPHRWEMTVPGYRALLRELGEDPVPPPVIGREAARRVLGLPVDIVPGPRIDWSLKTAVRPLPATAED